MPLRVARRRDGEKTRSRFPGAVAVENEFRIGLRGQFISMNDAATSEMLGVTLGISDVVSVRQKDMSDAAERFQLFHQRRDKFRRVDQPIACGVSDEVAVAAI